MSTQTVTIEKLVFGGAGLARTDSGIVFVNDAAPDEQAEIEITGRKGGAAFARITKLLKPSPSRRAPSCPLYGRCGGCDWLHIEYKTQVECKKEMIVDCMRRIGRIENLPSLEVIIAEESGYRQRVQLKIDKAGNAGFFARQTNSVVPVRRCPLLVDSLNRLLNEIADKKVSLPGPLKNLMAIAGDNNRIASYPLIVGQTTAQVMVTAGNHAFEVSGHSFFQSNRFLLERLGTWARAYVEGIYCVDLYGGNGFFSVMLADRFKEGILIESMGAEAMGAKANYERNGIMHFRAAKGTAENLTSLVGKKPIDCLIIDPPRPGLTPAAQKAIAVLKPKTVLYVSCNPSTQARDAGVLVNEEGYTISAAALVDLYPNTHHIESLLLLNR